MPPYAENQKYFELMFPHAKRASQATGLVPSVILSQWALETGYGSSDLARNGNNHGGIKNNGGGFTSGTYDGMHAKYDSISRFVDDYIRVINLNYLSHVRTAATPEDAIRNFTVANNNLKYAEDTRYSDKLLNIFMGYGLRGYDSYQGDGMTSVDHLAKNNLSGIQPHINELVEGMDTDTLKKYAGIGLGLLALVAVFK